MIATLERSPEQAAEPETRSQRKPLPIKVSTLSVIATLALTCVTLAITVSFCRIFPGWGYLRSLVIIAVVMHGYGLFSRWRRWTLLPVLCGWEGAAVLAATQILHLLEYRIREGRHDEVAAVVERGDRALDELNALR